MNITMDEIVKLTKKNKLKPMKIVKHNKNIDYNKLRISNSQSFYWWLNEQ